MSTVATPVSARSRIQPPARVAQISLAAAAITSSIAFAGLPQVAWSGTNAIQERHSARAPFADMTAMGTSSRAFAERNSHPKTGNSVARLRELSNLTADQIARLFDVSRRSVQNWISGAPMAASHEERLSHLTSVITAVGTSPEERRKRLLSSANGMSIFHQLIDELDDETTLEPASVSVRDRLLA